MLNTLKEKTNYTLTENSDLTHKSTLNAVLDLFAFGGSMRQSSKIDKWLLFEKAFDENENFAMKCLFYLRDITEGQGERDFFRVCLKGLAEKRPERVAANLWQIPEFGRWDDLYCLVDTPVEKAMWEIIKQQLMLDLSTETPSLLGKWLTSCNASSRRTKYLGNKTRIALGMTQKQYRKTLSLLRAKINIVERLMSQNRWDEIKFETVPSIAGIKYRNAFAKHDIERMKKNPEVQSYKEFAAAVDTVVNTKAMTPVDIAHEAFKSNSLALDNPRRQMLNKMWEQLPDFYNGRTERGIAVVDTSGSMWGKPIEAAVSLGAYIAEKGGAGPFANHFITFSNYPDLVEFRGVDIVDKFNRAEGANWDMNTNIQATMDLLLDTAISKNLSPDSLPERIYILSDMQFDECVRRGRNGNSMNSNQINTFMEEEKIRWAEHGYKLPSIVFWNLNSKTPVIPAIGEGFSYLSGFSPSLIPFILSGKDGWDICLEKLLSDRYKNIV